jgi:hypothetical protein
LTQVLRFVATLKDTIEGGDGQGRIGFRQDAGPSPGALGPFITQAALETRMRTVRVTLESFSQEMKGAPLEFGGVSFQSLDSGIAWARTHMPVATYQCIPGMFYGLCLIRETVLYKEDMRDDNIQAHWVKRSPMQSAVVESVNTAVPSIMEGPKTTALKDPKYKFGALKTFAAWKHTNGQGGALGHLKDGLEAAWQQIKGVINLFMGGEPSDQGCNVRNVGGIQDSHLLTFCCGGHFVLQRDTLQDRGRLTPYQGGTRVMLGARHQATKHNFYGGAQGARVLHGGCVNQDGHPGHK